jgi:hypothetical protein
MNKVFRFFIFFLIFASTKVHSLEFVCPLTIDVEQRLKSKVEGWEVVQQIKPRFGFLSILREGRSTGLLVPTKKGDGSSELVFGADKYWVLRCSYLGTNVALLKRLPVVKKCVFPEQTTIKPVNRINCET